MIEIINKNFVTMFGIGNISKIPGSIASLITTILLFILFQKINFSVNIFLFILIGIFFLSLFSINLYIKDFKDKDPKEIVIDEFIGQSIPICLYELAHQDNNNIKEILISYFTFFILFRIFDITKPYPVSYYDKNFKNSIGVVMDDVCAGLYVVAVMVLYMVTMS